VPGAVKLSPYACGRRQKRPRDVAPCTIIKECALYHMQVFAKYAKFSMVKPAETIVYIGLDTEQ